MGFSYSSFGFDRIRGAPMDDLQLTFVHENTDFPNCDVIFGGDCESSGVPLFEHDVIDLGMDLRIQAAIYAFNATFGVLDWLDIGVAVPVVRLEIQGRSTASVSPANVDDIQHFFGGTPADPVLTATTSAEGSTTGLGDIAARAKIRVLDSDQLDVALLGEVRVPTGRSEDFLGTGEASYRGLFIGSATLEDFSPHMNFGYARRGGDLESDAFQFAVGFDQRLSDWATFVIDLLGDFKLEDPLGFPEPFTFDPPVVRTVERANIPDIRDDVLDGSVGFKLKMQGGVVIWGNALIALNDGGMRSGATATFGFQYSSR